MPVWLAVVLTLAAGSATLIQTLGLFILRDLQARVMRLENALIGVTPFRHLSGK